MRINKISNTSDKLEECVRLSLKYAHFNRVFGTLLCGFLLLFAGLNFVCDPLLIFHPPWFKEIYSSNERFRIPGFARSIDYDTALVGASSAMAIHPADIQELLKVRPVIQVIGGATLAEESLAAEVTLNQGKASRILWILDPLIFNWSEWRPDVQMPRHLYREDLAGKAQYLLDRVTLKMSLMVLKYAFGGPISDEFVSNLGNPYTLPSKSNYSPESVRKAFHSTLALAELNRRERAMYTPFDEERTSLMFEKYIHSLVRRNPDVHFDIVLSPSTVAFYQFMQMNFPHRLEQYQLVRKLSYERLTVEENVRVYDLQINQAITTDYEQFSDMLHFSPDVGRRILEVVRDGHSVVAAGEPAARAAIKRSITKLPHLNLIHHIFYSHHLCLISTKTCPTTHA